MLQKVTLEHYNNITYLQLSSFSTFVCLSTYVYICNGLIFRICFYISTTKILTFGTCKIPIQDFKDVCTVHLIKFVNQIHTIQLDSSFFSEKRHLLIEDGIHRLSICLARS